MYKMRITLGVISIFFTYLSIALTARVPSTSVRPPAINNGSRNSSQEHLEEMNKWPKVFILSPDPNYPVVCYSGVSLNFSSPANNETTESSGGTATEQKTEDTSQRNVTETIFSLSSDPSYPVTCRVGHIPANLTDGATDFPTVDEDEEGGNITNITCIRRDYEKNVSAIFLFKTGPLQLAWNVFDSRLPYGYMTVKNVESIGSIKLLNETIVECEDYGFTIGDKGTGLSAGCAASLCG